MGIFGKITGIFKRDKGKKTVETPTEEAKRVGRPPRTPMTMETALPKGKPKPAGMPRPAETPRPTPPPAPEVRGPEVKVPRPPAPLRAPAPAPREAEEAQLSNVRAKLDLILTEIDNLKTQNQNINERLKAMERTISEMKGIRYY